MTNRKSYKVVSMLDGIEAWVNKMPMPVGVRIGDAGIVSPSVEDVPVVLMEFVREIITSPHSDQRVLDKFASDIHSSFDHIVRNVHPNTDDVFVYKSLDVLLNITALSLRADLLAPMAGVLNSSAFSTLPDRWKEQLADAFLHAVFQLAYVGIHDGKVKNAVVGRSVRDCLGYLMGQALLTEKHAHIAFFLILVSTEDRNDLVWLLNLLVKIESPDRIADFDSMEDWYKEPIVGSIRSHSSLFEIKARGFDAFAEWLQKAPKASARIKSLARIRCDERGVTALANFWRVSPRTDACHAVAG